MVKKALLSAKGRHWHFEEALLSIRQQSLFKGQTQGIEAKIEFILQTLKNQGPTPIMKFLDPTNVLVKVESTLLWFANVNLGCFLAHDSTANVR